MAVIAVSEVSAAELTAFPPILINKVSVVGKTTRHTHYKNFNPK